MADGGGYPHFQQPGHRNFIPFARVGRGSPPRQNETPSPSRSPGPQSPAGYNLYGQPQQQQGHSQHVLLNGTGGPSHQRYTMQMNLAHKFQQQQHQQVQQAQQQQQQKQQLQQQQQQQQQPSQQQQQQHQPPQQPIPQSMHSHQQLQQQLQQNQLNSDLTQAQGAGNTNGASGTVLGHQHTFSNPPTTNFGSPQHLTNGNNVTASNVNVPQHWQEQIALYQNSRQSGSPHHNARVAAAKTRSIQAGAAMNLSSLMTMQIEDNDDLIGDDDRRLALQNTSEKDKRQDWIALDFGGQGLRALSETLFAYTFLDKLFINHNKLTSLPSTIGKLKLLSHLDASGNSLTDLPVELGLLTNLRYLLLFDNRITQLPGELGTLFQLEVLGIEGNPLNEATKLRMMKEGTKACIHYLRENCSITLPPVVRDWNILDGSGEKADLSKELEKFSVISYNILCDKYATPAAYGYTASWALAWEYRRNIILEELQNHKGDIVCLQEVDMGSFEDYFSPNLAYDSFKGVFFPKTRARNMSAIEQKTVDGCATFFKSTKFNLLDKQVVDITRAALNRADMKKTTDIFNRVMPRDNIATVTYLEHRQTGIRLIVANVHLHWDPAFRDVKIVQTALLLEELGKLADRYASDPPPSKNNVDNGDPPIPKIHYSDGSKIPVIICGDLNSKADSGVYELLARGQIPPHHTELDGRDYGNVSNLGVQHQFQLKSAYAQIGELAFTTYTPGFVGAIDYIWYSTAAMQVTGLLGDVDKNYIERVAGIPNVHFPSDHLLILAEFQFKQARKEIAKPPPPDFGNTSKR